MKSYFDRILRKNDNVVTKIEYVCPKNAVKTRFIQSQ